MEFSLQGIARPLRRRYLIERRRIAELLACRAMRGCSELWGPLSQFRAKSKSTGCSHADYWTLYKEIRSRRPREILECGGGISTLVIAAALCANAQEDGIAGRVTSMEEHEEWQKMAQDLMPKDLASYVDFVLSETVEDVFSLFRGVRYRNIPELNYDFVFVDGPGYKARSDGSVTFDMDFVHILAKSERMIAGLVDKRVSTVFVLQQLLGYDKVVYNPVTNIGFVSPANKNDLHVIPLKTPSLIFEPSYSAFGKTRLTMGNCR